MSKLSDKERSQRLYHKRRSLGLKQVKFWITPSEKEQLSIVLATIRKLSNEKEKN